MDESKLIEEKASYLRAKDKSLRKKYGFETLINYFDADELTLHLRDAAAILKREDGQEIVITAIPDYKDEKKRMVIAPESVVELSLLPREHIEAIVVSGGSFGAIGTQVLSAPGLDEMKKYCSKLTEEITDVGLDLKAKSVNHIFEKLYKVLGGEVPGKKDLLVQRVRYFKDVCSSFAVNKKLWKPEMKRLGLIK